MFAELLEEMQRTEARIMARFDKLETILADQGAKIEEILLAVTLPPAEKGTLRITFGSTTKEGDNFKMKVPMNATGIGTVSYTKKNGGKGRTDGPPVWTADPPEFATLTPASDGLTCSIVTAAVPEDTPVQSVIISVDADSDLGDGKKDIVLTGLLDVYDPDQGAVLGEISFGEFVPNPVV